MERIEVIADKDEPAYEVRVRWFENNTDNPGFRDEVRRFDSAFAALRYANEVSCKHPPKKDKRVVLYKVGEPYVECLGIEVSQTVRAVLWKR